MSAINNKTKYNNRSREDERDKYIKENIVIDIARMRAINNKRKYNNRPREDERDKQ